ncbi:MAG: hypothetical protein Q4D91_14255, partial [Lautropia sp.]|nr:hypothetical protein [Lautropia sp.]
SPWKNSTSEIAVFQGGLPVDSMTLDEIRKAAKRWLVPHNRTVAWYLPTKKPLRAPEPTRTDIAAMLKDHPWPTGTAFTADEPITPAYITAQTQKGTLPMGIEYALLPRKMRGQRARISLDLRWGSLKSLTGRKQDAVLLDDLIMLSTKKLSEKQIRDRLIDLEADLSISASHGGAELYLDVPRRNIAAAMTLAASLLQEPVFRQDHLEEARRNAISRAKAYKNDPDALIAEELVRRAKAYPIGDPRRARQREQSIKDLEAQTTARLARFWKDFAGASTGELAAVGDSLIPKN